MAETVVTIKRWGSSAAVILPAALVKAEHLKEGDEIVIDVRPVDDISSIFGMWKDGPKIDAQSMKDETRREEAESDRRKWGFSTQD